MKLNASHLFKWHNEIYKLNLTMILCTLLPTHFKTAFKATSSHQNQIQSPEKLKWSTRDGSLAPNSVMTFLYLIVPLPLIIPSQLIMSAPALD